MTTPIHSDGTITITVNGQHKRVTAGLSIAALANELGLVPEKVAVERNLEIVPRSTLADVCLEDGDELEIVHFVGGGDHPATISHGAGTKLDIIDAVGGESMHPVRRELRKEVM
jgi:thiazole synthase